MRRVSKTLIAALAMLLIATGLAACGGDDGSTSADTAAQGKSESDSNGAKQEAAKDGGDRGKSGEGEGGGASGEGQSDAPSAGDFTPRQHDDSGGGSQQFKVKGGDNSVQEFGEEADTSEFDAAATALHNFLDARAEGNWAAACKYMAKAMIKSFEELAAKTKQVDVTGCAGVLEKLTNPAAKASMKAEAAQADIGSLRIEDDRAFLIYTAVGKTILAIPMENEDGAWKVGSLAGTPLN